MKTVYKNKRRNSKYFGSYKVFDKVWKKYRFKERRPGNLIDSYFEELRVRELGNLLRGKRTVINIGSGSGRWSIPFLKMGYRIVNFDISHYALLLSRTRCKEFKTDYVRGDVNAMPFKDDSFDVVMSFGLLEHFRDIELPINEMVRILRTKGLFLSDVITKRFSVHTFERWINFFLYLIYALIQFEFVKLRRSIWFIYKDYYENGFSQQEYLKSMRKAGLNNTNITGIRGFPIIMLPYCIEKYYLPIFKLFGFLWRDFDLRNTKFSRFWGAIWELKGTKR